MQFSFFRSLNGGALYLYLLEIILLLFCSIAKTSQVQKLSKSLPVSFFFPYTCFIVPVVIYKFHFFPLLLLQFCLYRFIFYIFPHMVYRITHYQFVLYSKTSALHVRFRYTMNDQVYHKLVYCLFQFWNLFLWS